MIIFDGEFLLDFNITAALCWVNTINLNYYLINLENYNSIIRYETIFWSY